MPSTTAALSRPLPNPSFEDIKQYDSQAFANSDVILAAAGTFLAAWGVNKGGAILWLMFFDAVSLPANGTIPNFLPIPIPPNDVANVDLSDVSRAGDTGVGPTGTVMATGMVWAASTTAGTLTIDATASMWVTARRC